MNGTAAQQTNQCFDNLFAVLDSAGLTFDDVVSVQVYLTNMADFQEMNAAYERRFTPPYPAQTTMAAPASHSTPASRSVASRKSVSAPIEPLPSVSA